MIDVALCIGREHDPRLVALAVFVCLVGSAATAQLFGRVRATRGRSRIGWLVLCSVGTGTMVWCTHFIAMMAYRALLPVTLDAGWTMLSLAVAIVVMAPGLALAADGRRALAAPGGTVIGLAVGGMHYVGMSAYRIAGIAEWRPGYVAASLALSCLLSAAAFVAFRGQRLPRQAAGALLLTLAVAALHFTGMTAMRVVTLTDAGDAGLSDGAQTALGFSIACAGLLFVGCAAVSALIDGQTKTESFERLRRMATRDSLTDLPNRMSFNEAIAARLAGRDGDGARVAVVMLDLTRFKGVNDGYGHQTGDQLLIALARRFMDSAQPGEMLARLGGDEFAALLSYADERELTRFLDRLCALFAAPFVLDRCAASVGASIGVAVSPQDGDEADALLARADLAMYRAKLAHSERPCFYDPGMDDAVRERRALAGELRQAVRQNQLELHYQVQASAVTGEIIGYEALARWRHPIRGMISPAEFIPLAEEIGEIVPLSDWVIDTACFEAALRPELRVVSVNLSPIHLSDRRLVGTVRDALERSGLPPSRLALELTEGAIIRDRTVALEQMHALRAMGIAVALDDFGVGYSSLDVLRGFAFDCIKLDASFVAAIEEDEHAVAILRSMVTLGASLRIPVLAEGVETTAQLGIVTREGCDAVQGYLLGRPSREPADPAAIRAAIAAQPPPPRLTAAA